MCKKNSVFDYNFACYKDDQEQKYAVQRLFYYGIGFFNRVEKIINIQTIADYVRDGGILKYAKDTGDDNIVVDQDYYKIEQITNSALIDNILLSVSFEAFLKGKLLQKGMLIHRIKKSNIPELNELKGNQKNSPILISDYKKYGRIQYEENKKHYTYDHLSKNTLNVFEKIKFNNFDYIENFELPTDIIPIIMQTNEYRNQLHYIYFGGSTMAYGKTMFRDLVLLIQYVNKDIILTNNALVEELGLHPRLKKKEIPIPKE